MYVAQSIFLIDRFRREHNSIFVLSQISRSKARKRLPSRPRPHPRHLYSTFYSTFTCRQEAVEILAPTTTSGEEDTVPQILVVADVHDDTAGAVVYREGISLRDLESDHFSGQLVERVGWAVLDADELEHKDDQDAE